MGGFNKLMIVLIYKPINESSVLNKASTFSFSAYKINNSDINPINKLIANHNVLFFSLLIPSFLLFDFCFTLPFLQNLLQDSKSARCFKVAIVTLKRIHYYFRSTTYSFKNFSTAFIVSVFNRALLSAIHMVKLYNSL